MKNDNRDKFQIPVDVARCERVIVTTIKRRGTGVNHMSPIRVVTQVWTERGLLIAEDDPVNEEALHLAELREWEKDVRSSIEYVKRRAAEAGLVEHTNVSLEDIGNALGRGAVGK